MLCVGGAITYLVCEDSGVSDALVLEQVTPSMHEAGTSCQVCIVLGRALLWKIWEASAQGNAKHGDLLTITTQVMVAVHNISTRNWLEAGTHPIRRANLGVSSIDTEVYVFKMLDSGRGGGTNRRDADGRDPYMQAGN